MNTQSLHFRVGADAGILLMNIAQEHLLYGLDIDKALGVFNDSFGGGCPEEMQLALLKGDLVITVDEEEQMFEVTKREEHHNAIFPAVINFVKWSKEQQKILDKHCSQMEHGLDQIINKFRYKDTYRYDFSVKSIIGFIYGNDQEIIDEILEDYELNRMKMLIKLTREFIAKSFKLKEIFEKISGLYGIDIKLDTYELFNLAQKVKDIGACNFILFTEGEDDVTKYIDATKEIDAVVSKGIEPVDIMENYTAGWLSPNGDYYAFNGQIANMLHNQIASALQGKDLIPENDEKGMELNPDAWLEQNGWVKIHENKVQFAGNLNHKLANPKPNIRMTDKQIEIINDYISNCFGCVIKAGWRLEKQSIGMFTAMAMSDHLALNKKYFDFD